MPEQLRRRRVEHKPRRWLKWLAGAFVACVVISQALFPGHGLGAHLEQLGLAKSFLAFGEWTDEPVAP